MGVLDVEEVFAGASCCICEVCSARKSLLYSQAINALFVFLSKTNFFY